MVAHYFFDRDCPCPCKDCVVVRQLYEACKDAIAVVAPLITINPGCKAIPELSGNSPDWRLFRVMEVRCTRTPAWRLYIGDDGNWRQSVSLPTFSSYWKGKEEPIWRTFNWGGRVNGGHLLGDCLEFSQLRNALVERLQEATKTHPEHTRVIHLAIWRTRRVAYPN